MTMHTGVAIFPSHETLGPGEVAKLVEERGHESLFFTEHTHIPASRLSPYPLGGDLPREYSRTFDLFVAMTAAALSTSRLRVGSGICLVTERDPIITAKEVASIDTLSGGRVEFGVGAGWNREEVADHGVDPRIRMAVMKERVAAIKAIWTQDEASYAGEHVSFERIWSWPKPAQRPHPPVLVGGWGPTVLDRVLAVGDAWLAIYAASPDLEKRTKELHANADRPIQVQVWGVPADPQVLDDLERLGVTRALYVVPSAGIDPIEQALDEFAAAVAKHRGG
jgi:probable F420-dependent oxidoreductase